MGLKEVIENNAPVILFGTLVTGFLAGIGTMSFLEGREKEQREQIEAHEKEQQEILVAKLQAQKQELQVSNEQLDKAVKALLIKYVDTYVDQKYQAISSRKPPGGDKGLTASDREDIVKHINQANHGELNKFVRDPVKCVVGRLWGSC
jgi:hypothetical protein